MNWLEIIELRSFGNDPGSLELRLHQLVAQVRSKANHPAIRVYVRQLIDSDLSIHLCHCSDMVDMGGSRLGLQLVSALKAFGLVNHRIWVELHDGPPVNREALTRDHR